MKLGVPLRQGAAVLALAAAGCGEPSSAARGAQDAAAATKQVSALRLTAPRAAHSVVSLPDGRVLFIGGCTEDSCETGPAGAGVDVYDPRGGTVRSAGRLTGPRTSGAVAVLPGGDVLVAGGWSGPAVTDAVERFDPSTGRSRRLKPLAVARADIATAVLDDGRVLLAGGYSGGRALDVVELFDPRTDAITRLPPLSSPRAGAMAVKLEGGRVLVVGGGEGTGSDLAPSNRADVVQVGAGSRRVGDLRTARYKHAAVAIGGGRVAVIGGSDARDNQGKIRSIEIFDPATERFTSGGSAAEARYKIGSAVVALRDGRVFIGGGGTRPEIYDPSAGRSSLLDAPASAPLNFAAAARLADGRVVVAGGYTEDGIHVTDAVTVYSP
ncbi:MAG TPA: kelch repeat-containing protein [Caulobacteraceae bacterium]|jgi:hypothetical protein